MKKDENIIIKYSVRDFKSYYGDEWERIQLKKPITVITGLNGEAAEWLAKKEVVNIGIDSMSIETSENLFGTPVRAPAHTVCRDYNINNILIDSTIIISNC